MKTNRRKQKNQGMNWITPHKRLAIYLRDGLACAYCGATIEDGVILTLDHIKCHSKGGSNHQNNLITSCRRCNSSRGTRSLTTFVKSVADYLNHGIKAETIMKHITNCRKRKLDINSTKDIISRRGNFSTALKSITNNNN